MNDRILAFRRTVQSMAQPAKLAPASEPKGKPIAHPFAVTDVVVRSARTGEIVRVVNAAAWPDYGQRER